ncbi:MAG: tetratricopeptide repeat protein [Massilia sp.]
MSHLRLLRLSVLLGAVGFHAAQAQTPAAPATPAAAAAPAAGAPAAKPADTVRPDYAKIIDPATIKQLVSAKNTAELQDRVTKAEAFANKTPFESYLLDRIKLQLGTLTNNEAMTMGALEAISASGRLLPQEQSEVYFALGGTYYNAKNYPRAIELFKRYETSGGAQEKSRPILVRSYYLSGDYATAKTELGAVVAEAEKAGKTPSLEDLRLLFSSAAKTQDTTTYVATLEKLVKYYPSPEYWAELNNRLLGRKGIDERVLLDVLRLKQATTKAMSAVEYTDLAELALGAGFPGEAKQALEAGYAAKVLGTGAGAAKQKQLLDKATRQAADDAKTMASGEAGANKLKEGNGLVNLGHAYTTMGDYDKGIALMEKGIAKGISKHPDDYKLRLAVAYAKAGRKDDANKIFDSIKSNDGMGDIARYWKLWFNQPTAVAAGPATTPAAQ